MAVVFKFRDTKLKISHIFIISTLGLFAGNSNENTSIIVVLLTLIFILIEKKKKTFIIGLPFTLLGTLSLLLSPGQHERLQHPGFQLYREQSLFTRLWNYFSSSFFVDTFKSFSWLFVAFIFIAFIYFGKHQIPKKQNIIYSLIFFFSAVISNAAFGASYSFPVAQRAINGALVLFLIALSFFLNDLDYDRSSIYKKSLFYLVVLLCIPFSISYFYATKSVISLLGQFQVREKIILSGKKNNLSRIYIPNYYVGKLYNPSDSIDMFQGNLGDYYDVSPSVGITAFDKDVSFDYGNKKLINSKQFNVNRSLGQNIDLRAINFFQDKRTSNKYCLNLTFNNSLLNAYSPEEYLLFVHVFWKRGNNQGSTMLNADTSLNNELVNEENYIYSLPIGDIRPQDIVTIDTGIYDRTNKSNIVQTKIDIKNFVNN